VLLATLNAAGYRYAASDQAFYIPAALRRLDPALFPRDAPLIDAQAHLVAVDALIAWTVRITGASLQQIFLAAYVLTLLLLYAGLVRLGTRLYAGRWTVVAFAAALTLRHAIAKTGVNTLESYFHPRELAFALGLLAVDGFFDRRWLRIAALLAAAACIHSTTALWFIAWLAVAAWARAATHRGLIAAGVIGGGALAAALLLAGPLAGRLIRMDPDWLAAIGPKDLFPAQWPLNVWLTNLLPLPLIAYGWQRRRAARLLVPGETPLVVGAFGLFVLFLCWLPFDVAHVAIAVQLQLSRVFWILDVFATVYVVWLLAEGRPEGLRDTTPDGRPDALRYDADAATAVAHPFRAAAVAAVIVVLSLGRGIYSKVVDFPDRQLFAVDIQHPDWRDAMAFARGTDPASGWLADPLHAAQYGSSLRAAGHRDVLIERIKDHAIGIYDRPMAMRVAERERALAALPWDTPDGARALARRYGLDYLVVDHPLELPLAHRSGSLYIYTLR
jgi:hypothetical protein